MRRYAVDCFPDLRFAGKNRMGGKYIDPYLSGARYAHDGIIPGIYG